MAYILGVGMTKFVKPHSKNDYVEMGLEAGVKALLDAQITYDDVDRGIASYCYGDSTCGQRIFYQFGMTQIPIINVNNNCASGSTAVSMARELAASGIADCILVIGFEKMARGSLGTNFSDRTNPLDRAMELANKTSPNTAQAPFAAHMFGNAAKEYMDRFGATAEDFAEIARVIHKHSQRNPYSQIQNVYTLQEIIDSPMICDPLTKLQCCPTSDGAAAAVVVSQRFLDSRVSRKDGAVRILGQHLSTDSPAAYDGSDMNLVGHAMVKHTAARALQEAGLCVEDIAVAEVHDCFSSNEMLVIDAIGFAASGQAHEYVRRGAISFGSGRAVINPSGGLISKGHPLGASGVAQCAELVWQLRGWANNRLVRVNVGSAALQQNAGLGGACVVTVLQRIDQKANDLVEDSEVARLSRLGYNPATKATGINLEQLDSIRSKHHSAEAGKRGILRNSNIG